MHKEIATESERGGNTVEETDSQKHKVEEENFLRNFDFRKTRHTAVVFCVLKYIKEVRNEDRTPYERILYCTKQN